MIAKVLYGPYEIWNVRNRSVGYNELWQKAPLFENLFIYKRSKIIQADFPIESSSAREDVFFYQKKLHGDFSDKLLDYIHSNNHSFMV